MRRLIVLLVLCVFVLSGYFLVRRSGGDVVEAFNHTNLIPYEAVAGQYLEPKI